MNRDASKWGELLFGSTGDGIMRPGKLKVANPAGVFYRLTLVAMPGHRERSVEVFVERRKFIGWQFVSCYGANSVDGGWRILENLAIAIRVGDFTHD